MPGRNAQLNVLAGRATCATATAFANRERSATAHATASLTLREATGAARRAVSARPTTLAPSVRAHVQGKTLALLATGGAHATLFLAPASASLGTGPILDASTAIRDTLDQHAAAAAQGCSRLGSRAVVTAHASTAL